MSEIQNFSESWAGHSFQEVETFVKTFVGTQCAVCSTSIDTAAKTVTIGGTPALVAGLRILVDFQNGNSAENPTLNVNNLGAKGIKYKNNLITTDSDEIAMLYGICDLVYDGTQWNFLGGGGVTPTPTILFEVYKDAQATQRPVNGEQYTNLFVKVGANLGNTPFTINGGLSEDDKVSYSADEEFSEYQLILWVDYLSGMLEQPITEGQIVEVATSQIITFNEARMSVDFVQE